MAAIIRDAAQADIGAVQQIYAWYVSNHLASFEEVAPDVEEMLRRWREVRERGYPYVVAELDGAVVGYAYASAYRTRSAYRYTAENSVYVRHDIPRRGLGKALMAEVITRCELRGLRQMIAVIGDSANAASIGLHAALGFHPTGILHGVGFKHRRWVDSIVMQRTLGFGSQRPPEEG